MEVVHCPQYKSGLTVERYKWVTEGIVSLIDLLEGSDIYGARGSEVEEMGLE